MSFSGCSSTSQAKASRLNRGPQEFASKERREQKDKREGSSLPAAFCLWADCPSSGFPGQSQGAKSKAVHHLYLWTSSQIRNWLGVWMVSFPERAYLLPSGW